MQYEFPHFRIDRKDFLKGSNSYDNYPDGGVQYSYAGYDAFSKPGWIANSPYIGNVVTGSLPVTAAISIGYGKSGLSQQVIAVGTNANQDGYFYTVGSNGAFTQVGSADTGRDYQIGKTWTVFYHSEFYTTSTTDICKNSADLATRDTSWWVTTKGRTSLDPFAPHPQVVFGDIHYIADGRYLHQNDNGTVQYNVFDLGPDWVITDLVVYNNFIYIAAEPYYNYSGSQTGFSTIFTWNGYADSWIDEWHIGARINAMFVFKSVLYIWTPKFVNYFNGSTIKSLYPFSSSHFAYSSCIGANEDSMFYPDGQTLVRYGSPITGGKMKFHRFEIVPDPYISAVAIQSSTEITICTTGNTNGSNYYVNLAAGPSGNNAVKFNRRIFNRPVKVRGYVIHTDGMQSGQYVEMSYTDDQGLSRAVKRFGYAASAAMQGKHRWRFDVSGTPATATFDPYVTFAGSVYVQAIDVLYESSESRMNA